MDDFNIQDLPSYIERLWNNLISSQVPTDFGNVTYYGLLRDALLMVKKLAETWTQKSTDFDTQIKKALELIDSAQNLLDIINIDVQQIRADVNNALQEVNDELDKGLKEINDELDKGLKKINDELDKGLQNILNYVKTYLASDEFSSELDSKITAELTPYFEKINNAVEIMGDYEIVDDDPVQIRFRKGNGEYGEVIDLGDGLASKNMVNAGYYRYTGKMYSGASSDYGIEVRKIVGAYKQDGTPTPDNPVEPQFFSMENFYTSGKNLFDINKITNVSGIVNNNDGTITVTTNETTAAISTKKTLKELANLKVGETYTLSAETTGSDKYIYLSISKKAWYFGSSKTITQDDLDGKVLLYASGINTTAIISNIQIELGKVATPYTLYVGSSTTPVSLELRALPDGTADVWEDGSITRNVAKVTFDGSIDEQWESYSLYGYNGYDIILPNMRTGSRQKFLCNIYKANGLNDDGVWFGVDSNFVYFPKAVADTGAQTLEEWRTYLSQHPIDVYYALATPTTEPLAIPTLTSYYPFTNAWCDSQVQGDITWDILNVKGMLKDYQLKTDAESIYLSKYDASDIYLSKIDADIKYLPFTNPTLPAKSQLKGTKNDGSKTSLISLWEMANGQEFVMLGTSGMPIGFVVKDNTTRPIVVKSGIIYDYVAFKSDIPKIGRVNANITVTGTSGTVVLERAYPIGFNYDNCIVIGVGETYTSTGRTIDGIHTSVILDSHQTIRIRFNNPELGSETVIINVLLMKLPNLGG